MLQRIVLPFLLIWVLAACCRKDYDEFSNDELSWLPYQAGDTLTFTSDSGNIDTWIITNYERREFSYGISSVGSKCEVTYYHTPVYQLDRIGDEETYIFAFGRESNGEKYLTLYRDKNNSIFSALLPQKGETINLLASSFTSRTIDNPQFIKGKGLIQYGIIDSGEIYYQD